MLLTDLDIHRSYRSNKNNMVTKDQIKEKLDKILGQDQKNIEIL